MLIYTSRRSKRGDVTEGTGHSDSKNLATVSIEASLFSRGKHADRDVKRRWIAQRGEASIHQ